MPNGDTGGSGIPILGPILQALGGLFSGAGQVQDLARVSNQVEQAAWQNTFGLATWAFGQLGGMQGFLDGLKKWLHDNLWHWLKDILWGHIKAIFERIRKWILNLRNWIKVHVAALQQIQRNLDRARSKYFRAIIDVVQRIRKILVPFRLLHLRFARELDARLAGFEGDLGRKWANLVRHQNAIVGVLDLIIDPRGLLRPGSVLGSLGAMIAAVHGAIAAADIRTLFCLGPDVPASPLLIPLQPYADSVVDDVRHNRGYYAELRAASTQLVRAIDTDLGLPTAL